MTALFKYRILFITGIFAAFGGALKLLLQIDELQTYYSSLAPLLALIVSFLISFLLKAKWTVSLRNKLKIVSIVLFAAVIIVVFFYTRLFIKSTFKFVDYKDQVSYHVKGLKSSYTKLALDYKKTHPEVTSDEKLVALGFEGPHNKKFIWEEDSINDNLLLLISGYCLLVILIVAELSFIIEILNYKSKKREKSKLLNILF